MYLYLRNMNNNNRVRFTGGVDSNKIHNTLFTGGRLNYKRVSDYNSDYKYVKKFQHPINKEVLYKVDMTRMVDGYAKQLKRCFKKERDAAVAADKFLISIGCEPVNVFKRKV